MLRRYYAVNGSPVPSLLSLSSSSIQNERSVKVEGRPRWKKEMEEHVVDELARQKMETNSGAKGNDETKVI